MTHLDGNPTDDIFSIRLIVRPVRLPFSALQCQTTCPQTDTEIISSQAQRVKEELGSKRFAEETGSSADVGKSLTAILGTLKSAVIGPGFFSSLKMESTEGLKV